MGTPYTFTHDGKEYSVSQVTQGIRGKFVAWMRKNMLKRAKETLEPKEYAEYVNQIMSGGISMEARQAAAATPAGMLYFMRIILGDSGKDLSDEQIFDMAGKSIDFKVITDMMLAEIKDPKAARAILDE